MTAARVLLDGPALARAVGRSPGTLRAWASGGLIRSFGRDRQGRVMYDVDEVIGVSQDRARRERTVLLHQSVVAEVCPGERIGA